MIRKTARKILAIPFIITQGVVGALAEFCLWVGQAASNADTRGNSLPSVMAPFFFRALYVTTATVAATAAILLVAETQGAATPAEAIERGAKLAPGLLAAAVGGAFFLTPLLYYGSGGVAMIGNLLKRMEEKSRNPERAVTIRKLRKENAEKDGIIERQQQENRELKERLGITGEDC